MDSLYKLKCIVLIVVLLLVFGVFISKANSDELHYYKVYGQNKSTGLMVAGRMWEADKQGNLTAKVWDEFDIYDHCEGHWVGHGVAEVRCENKREYVLIVEEK